MKRALFSEFVRDTYLPWAGEHHSAIHLDKYFCEIFCKHFAGMRLAQLSTHLIEGYKQNSINLELAFLSKICSLAVKHRRMRENPCRGEDGQPLTKPTLRWAFTKACARAGLLGLTFHALRHTFGTRLGENGMGVEKIKRLMGHANIKMTERYVHPSDDALTAAVESISGKVESQNRTRRASSAKSTRLQVVVG